MAWDLQCWPVRRKNPAEFCGCFLRIPEVLLNDLPNNLGSHLQDFKAHGARKGLCKDMAPIQRLLVYCQGTSGSCSWLGPRKPAYHHLAAAPNNTFNFFLISLTQSLTHSLYVSPSFSFSLSLSLALSLSLSLSLSLCRSKLCFQAFMQHQALPARTSAEAQGQGEGPAGAHGEIQEI